MITTEPPIATNRAVPVAVDRAIPGPDRQDSTPAATSRPFHIDPDPEPKNRRGRRHDAREERRARRQVFRASVQRKIEETRFFAELNRA